MTTSPFDLPDRLAAKAGPGLIATDEQHFAAIVAALEAAISEVIRAVLPDANVPVSIREGGLPVVHAPVTERDSVLDGWLAAHPDGIACVIGDPAFQERPRVRSLTPVLAKGLEFDLVVLVDADTYGEGVEGAVDRYVAMTRATQQLVVLTRRIRRDPCPWDRLLCPARPNRGESGPRQ